MTSLAYEASKNPHILEGFSEADLLKLEYDWGFWARPDQIEPIEFVEQEYLAWLILAGRGWGKSKTGAETTNNRVKNGTASRIGLIAPSAADARDVMVEGPSGIVTISPPWFKAKFEPSKRRVIWPNGATATIYSAEDPDQLRGPQHDWIWMDELAAWPHLTMQEVFDNAMFGLRQGRAQYMVTTTPRPIELVRNLVKRDSVYVTKGSTYDNLHNLSTSFREQVVTQYEGTRLGRQELNAEILDDNPDALWTIAMIEDNRIKPTEVPPLKRIGIAVDPMGSRKGHEIGIVAGGIAYDGQGYLLRDASASGVKPAEWGKIVCDLYHELEADFVVMENNFGGDMVANVIINIDPTIPIKEVRASRGKTVRAEPVSMLYERGVIHHAGMFSKLEDQLTTYLPEEGANDRLDANVWLWTYLRPARVKGAVWFIS